MMRIAIATLAFAVTAAAAQAATIEHVEVTTVDGQREYWIATPDRAIAGPHPLVILLHGHGGSANQIIAHSGASSPLSMWLPIVDREQIVAVALQGRPDSRGRPAWNDCRRDAPNYPQVDDVAFVRAVIGDVERRGLFDRTRLYAMGMSNGAMMTLRLALELDPPLAAFAAVSGSMARDSRCAAPSHRMSGLFIAGTADPLVPYGGGQVHFFGRNLGSVLPIEESVSVWRRFDGLADAPSSESNVPAGGAGGTTQAQRIVYGRDSHQLQVELVRVVGGGHVEPSQVRHYGPIYTHLVGEQNRDFESAEEAWSFFSSKRLAD